MPARARECEKSSESLRHLHIDHVSSQGMRGHGPLSPRIRACRRDAYLQYLGSSHFFSHVKSDSTSLPGRLVVAPVSAPDAVQKKCWVFWFTADAVTEHVSPEFQVAFNVPALAPPVWLLTKCQVPVRSPQDCPLMLLMDAAEALPARASPIAVAMSH